MMNDLSALDSALLGIHRGMAGMRRNAAEIASGGRFGNGDPTGFIEPMVDLRANARQVEASAKALSIIDKTLGSIIDIEV